MVSMGPPKDNEIDALHWKWQYDKLQLNMNAYCHECPCCLSRRQVEESRKEFKKAYSIMKTELVELIV